MNTVIAPAVPLYQQGYGAVRHARRFSHLAVAPKIPLHSLGWMGANVPGLISIGATIGTKVATPGIVAATGATGVAAGALTAGIGAGVAILVGVIAGLWAAHEKRVAGAKAENDAINSAVQTFDAGIKAIFAAANSSDPTQNVTGAQASQQVQTLISTFFAQMAPYTHAAGAADASNGGANCGWTSLAPGSDSCIVPANVHHCDKSCTATCCVGCQDLMPTVMQAQAAFASPTGGSVKVCTVVGSKYGAVTRSSYTLTYTPPKITVSSGVSSILSDLTGSGSTGSSNWLPWALAGLAAFLVLR
jgi:hypothetical protein